MSGHESALMAEVPLDMHARMRADCGRFDHPDQDTCYVQTILRLLLISARSHQSRSGACKGVILVLSQELGPCQSWWQPAPSPPVRT